MATEVAQIPAEETPAVAAPTENPASEQAEKPAASETAAAAPAAAAPAAENENAQGNKEDGKAASKENADGAADGDAKKDGEAAAVAAPAKSEAPPAQKFNVHKTNFEKDIIYLYQFSRTPLLPSLSPYCLKVETWLRLVGLKYENVDHKMRFRSKKGQLPFIELNGEEIADSAIIIKELSSKYEKNLDSGLTAEQRNVSYATIAMLENHLIWIIFYWRAKYPDNVLKGYKVNLQHALGLRLPNSILNFFFKITFGRKWFQGTKKLKAHGIGVHSAEEIEEFGKNDLKVLSEMLDCKPFFFGDEPTTLDVVAFAVLSQLHYLSKDIAYPLRDYMTEKCPNLIGHVSRMKDKCFPDWDEICTKLDLNAHIPKPEPETKEGKEGGEQEKSNEQEGPEGDKIEKELEKDKSNEKESTEENKEKEETK
ncbi:failed axon connections isoform X1 [Drosophila guanche]|uniref:Blast:Failed axon connections n=1 Tax=Drosophila guanche TaxID=7266 RepID=A0A3B0KT63_DROGU|nr:failed axon connections isoform X1 [Drosophila guanche]SPP87088.1 blast:Failed axon connections [Drosophila guanche]